MRQEQDRQLSANPLAENKKDNNVSATKLSIAPMMDWTDRHCRYLHRQISRRVLLYTEMVTEQAVRRGDRARLLGFDPAEQPVALQLGGSDPAGLAEAARIGAACGYVEINLNAGCPSDRVQSGCFGAVLMKSPPLVADCVAAMTEACAAEITVKCRIGVDADDPRAVLPRFLEAVASAGVRRVIVHARKAWLDGLSPKENREIPPLDHALVVEMKRAFPDLRIVVNGGIDSLSQARGFLALGLDGVMIGRAAYHAPHDVLAGADAAFWGDPTPAPTREAVVERMRPYIARHLAAGGRLHSVTRHMLGLYAGRPGARSWRRVLSEGAHRAGAGLDLLDAALAAVEAAPVAG